MKKYLPILILLLCQLILLTQLKFTLWPEMISFPYLVNSGYSLYGDLVYVYPPGLLILLSFITTIFGYNISVILLGTWMGLLINTFLVYKIFLLLINKQNEALFGAAIYSVVSSFLEGNMIWFDTAIVTPLLLAVYALLLNKKNSLYIAGAAVSVASLIKQTGVFYLVIVAIYVIYIYRRKSVKFFLPVVITGGLTSLWLLLTNQFDWFWNWVVYYPSRFWSNFPGYVDFHFTLLELAVLLSLSLPPVMLLFFKRNKNTSLISVLYLVALVAVYPRFSFFHLQAAIALSSICFGILMFYFRRVGFILALPLVLIVIFLSRNQWGNSVRFFDSDTFLLASEIEVKTGYSNNIYLLGLPSHLYQLTNSLPPSPWVDNYGWYFEIPEMQSNTIESWQNNMPAFIIWQKPNSGNWYEIGVYQPKEVVEWIENNYQEIDTINEKIKVMKKSV